MSNDVLQGFAAGLGDLAKSTEQQLVVTPGGAQQNPFALGGAPGLPESLPISPPKVQFLSPQNAQIQRALQLFGGQQQLKGLFADPLDQAIKLATLDLKKARTKKLSGGGGRRRGGGTGRKSILDL